MKAIYSIKQLSVIVQTLAALRSTMDGIARPAMVPTRWKSRNHPETQGQVIAEVATSGRSDD